MLTIGDTVLEVYSGSCSSLITVACNDDYCKPQSRVAVGASTGTTLYLRVGSYEGNVEGIFSVELNKVLLNNGVDRVTDIENCIGIYVLKSTLFIYVWI